MADTEKIPVTKEAIASRMFRNAARQWGLSDTNMDNFDPLVRLLIETCAVEIYQLSNQVDTVQERMIEKLANLLTPQVYVAPRPAHAVLHARAMDPDTLLSKSMQFFYHKKIASKLNGPLDSNIDLFFSPAGRYKVTDGDVKLIATGNNVYSSSDAYFQKDTFLRLSKPIPYRTVWLGIELNNNVEDITGLSFFFDLKNTPEKEKYLSLLPFSQCWINDMPVSFHKGLRDETVADTSASFQQSMDELYINSRIEQMTNAFYKDQFITISSENKLLTKVSKDMKQKCPPELEDQMGAKELALLNKELLWVKFKKRF